MSDDAQETRHYRVVLDMRLDPSQAGAVGPIGWDWHDVLDLGPQESVSASEIATERDEPRRTVCTVCFTAVRWPSYLDSAGRCDECRP
jgi:hypothetical protein